MFIITRNIIFNQFRKSFNENAYKTTVKFSSAEVEYDIENEMDEPIFKAISKKLISELTPRQQEVFHLSREEHLSYKKKIAIRLSISVKNSRASHTILKP
ncbi:hypothetical protein NXW73_20770 [Bacteroides fragilis]|nr:hypothetical protein [Bacteroides fragilis]